MDIQLPPPPPPLPAAALPAAPPPVVQEEQHPTDAAAAKKRRKSPSSAGGEHDAEHNDEYQQLKRRRKIEPRGVPWFVMLERLKQYRERYGSLNVPSTFRQDPKLASWVQYQRYLFHHKEIAEERKAALDGIGFEWAVLKPKSGGKKCTWDEQVARVAKYKEEHGNTLIPYSYQPDPSLGFWVSKQRKDYKHGQLSDEKISKLDQIGFIWKPPTGRRQGSKKKADENETGGVGNRQSTWEKMFDKLRHFQSIHGSEAAHSRSDLNAIDKTLATWIKTQRHTYTIKKMAPDRIAKLESIGFAWRVGQDWKDFFARLKDHTERFGNCDLPANEDPRLAAWIDSQRVSYKYRELSKERVDLLKSIGFSFVIDEGLEALEASAPPVDDDGLPVSMQHVAAKTDPSQPVNEYNIAMQLAGLAEPKAGETAPQVEVGSLKVDDTATAKAKEEGNNLVLVDGMESADKEAAGMQIDSVQQSGDEPLKARGEPPAPEQQTEDGEALHTEDDELVIQAEIVELQEEKVRLQEEKVTGQQEKLALFREMKELEARKKDLTRQVSDQAAKDVEAIAGEGNKAIEKRELEEKAGANEVLLLQQAAQIKEQEEKLLRLQKESSEME